jgi:hypothetical protein
VLQVVSNLIDCAIRRAYRPDSTVVVRTGAVGLIVSNRGTGDQPAGLGFSAGSALGVVIARTLAGAMGRRGLGRTGRSRGTTFTLRLPQVDGGPVR